MYSLYHIARADFLQRIRSPLFLFTLGVCMYVAYTFVPSPDADYVTVSLGNYRGLYNSSWVGYMMAMMCSVFLSLFGFYLVNNSVMRDFDTGLGQIIATTQVSNLKYLTGKALSNFAILLSIVAMVAAMGTALLLIKGETKEINLLQFFLPFLWITLPALAFVSALATVLESFRKLSSDLVNVLYFIAFMLLLGSANSHQQGDFALDLFGIENGFDLLKTELSQQVDDYTGGKSIGYLYGSKHEVLQTIAFTDVYPSLAQLLYRFYWLLLAGLMLGVAAMLFKRFDPSYDAVQLKSKSKNERPAKQAPSYIRHTQLPTPRLNFGISSLLIVEARLMLKGQSLWWWLSTAGLFIATFFTELSVAHQRLLLLLWLIQLVVWKGLGSREKSNHTEQLIFSAPHVLSRQLLASWLAAVSWAMLLAAVVLVRYALEGEWYTVGALLIGAMFLPSFALFGGIMTGGGKLFQVTMIILAYAVFQGMPFLDFMGAVAGSKEYGLPLIFGILTLGMLVLAAIGRKRQMRV